MGCMKKLHTKSPCCKASVRRFGNRRRQCIACSKTWRIRQKKRGRKLKLARKGLILQFFQKQLPPLRVIAKRRGCGKDTLQLLLVRSLSAYIRNHQADWLSLLEGNDRLIVIADAIWYRVQSERYCIYIILLRSVDTNEAVICPPVIVKGHEGTKGWQLALGHLPNDLENRIVALVSDGVGSLLALVKPRGWIIQRCHFHLISAVQNYLTTGPRSPYREYALKVMRLVQQILRCGDQQRLKQIVSAIQTVRNQSRSRGLRRVLGGLLNDLPDYHAYLNYPGLNLPTTSNAAESFIQCIRDLMYRCRGFRSLTSLQAWLKGLSIFKRTIRCNGKNQPN